MTHYLVLCDNKKVTLNLGNTMSYEHYLKLKQRSSSSAFLPNPSVKPRPLGRGGCQETNKLLKGKP